MSSRPDFPNTACVGMHFRGEHAKTFAAGLELGFTLSPEREPDNAYDMNAIKLMVEGSEEPWHLGYVDKHNASWAAYHMDEIAETGEGRYIFMVEDVTSGNRGNPIVTGTLKFVPAETSEAEISEQILAD